MIYKLLINKNTTPIQNDNESITTEQNTVTSVLSTLLISKLLN